MGSTLESQESENKVRSGLIDALHYLKDAI
jgi:hypothetical protein